MKRNKIEMIASLAQIGIDNGMEREAAITKAINVYESTLEGIKPNYMFQLLKKKGIIKNKS